MAVGDAASYAELEREVARLKLALSEAQQRETEAGREVARLNGDLTRALEEQTATADVLQAISRSSFDLQAVLQTLIENACRLCGPAGGIIYRVVDDLARLAATYNMTPESQAQMRNNPFPAGRGHVTARAMLERRTIHIPDAWSDPEYTLTDLIKREGVRSLLSVPMLREGQILGLITVVKSAFKPFTEREIELVETFADQAVIALENTRLLTELHARNSDLQDALKQQTAIADVLRVMSRSVFDLEPVLETLVKNAAELCGAQYGLIYRFDGESFRLAAAHNVPAEAREAVERSRPVPSRGSAVGRAALERRTVQIPDILADPEYAHPIRQLAAVRTMLGVPMLRDGSLIGAFALWKSEVEPFTDRQIELVETITDQAMIAIENTRLFRDLQARIEELQALGEVGQAVSSTLDVEQVLTTVVSRAVQLSGTDGGVIYEYDDATGEFLVRATRNLGDELIEALHATPIRLGEGAVGQAAALREPVEVADAREGEFRVQYGSAHVRDAIERSGMRALLAVPLLREDGILGGLVLQRTTPGAFAREVVALMQTFASQSALAIQNARLFREIEDKSRQLEIVSKHKSEFLANMSHELRTPLNAIIGFSELLQEEAEDTGQERILPDLAKIHTAGTHLLSLINDILDLSKVEAGRMELEPSTFSLRSALENGITLLLERANRHGISLGLEINPGLDAVEADERKVKQVVFNLLSNAVKFTPDGGRVELSAQFAGEDIQIAVRDTCIGIASDDLEHVFEEFRQVGTGAARHEGTGLGLPLAKRFVELHGGRMWVESEPGVGSTFAFTLPRPAARP
jgi:signal transduction histidine kinase